MDMIEKVKEITIIMQEINKEKSNLEKEQSKLDKQISNYTHLFECCKFPAHIRASLNKELDTILLKRRDVKVSLAQLSQIQSAMTKFTYPAIDKVKEAGQFKFRHEGFSQEEMNKYSKYMLPQYK